MSDLRDLTRIARFAVFVSYVFMVLSVVFSGFLLWSNQVYAAYLANESGTAELRALEQADNIFMVYALVFAVFMIVMYIINGRWIYLASYNAARVAPSEDRITPGWAVGWFFVPFANLWMPFKAMQQTWAASVGGGKLESDIPGWVSLWWGGWVLLTIIDGVTSNYGTGPFATPEEYMDSNIITAITGVLWVIPTFLFIRLIKTVTAAQYKVSEVFA